MQFVVGKGGAGKSTVAAAISEPPPSTSTDSTAPSASRIAAVSHVGTLAPVSTRKLLIAAFLCGMAILVAFTVQLVMLSGS